MFRRIPAIVRGTVYTFWEVQKAFSFHIYDKTTKEIKRFPLYYNLKVTVA
jgi:hypothetical protein